MPYFALPVPLVDGLVAVSLEGAVRGEASPGPAVVPVVGAPLAGPTDPAVPPPAAAPLPEAAAPALKCASHSAREIWPSLFLSRAEKSGIPVAPLAAPGALAPTAGELDPAVGAFGSPEVCGLGEPPEGPVPVLLAPAGAPDWARMSLSPSADACAASGKAKAPATATAINVLNFIAVS